MASFVQIGQRVINLDHVVAAERPRRGGPVTVYLAAGDSGEPLKWTFDQQGDADALWLKLTPVRGDLTDIGGGPYSITDNESTASRQDERP
jgi:hypothetical protein